MPTPKRPARISNQGLGGWSTKLRKPENIIRTIPKTRWWICSPPGDTFPGHQETSARIIRVLKRMKPNERSIEPEQDQARALIGGVERLRRSGS